MLVRGDYGAQERRASARCVDSPSLLSALRSATRKRTCGARGTRADAFDAMKHYASR